MGLLSPFSDETTEECEKLYEELNEAQDDFIDFMTDEVNDTLEEYGFILDYMGDSVEIRALDDSLEDKYEDLMNKVSNRITDVLSEIFDPRYTVIPSSWEEPVDVWCSRIDNDLNEAEKALRELRGLKDKIMDILNKEFLSKIKK